MFTRTHTAATPRAIAPCSLQHPTRCLRRHFRGDWEHVCAEDKGLKDQALVEGERVVSAYAIDDSKPAKKCGENCQWLNASRLVSSGISPSGTAAKLLMPRSLMGS